MNKCHTPITWHNDTTPAINETNLNYEDGCIDTIDDRVVAMDTSKANQSDLLKAFKDVSLNTTTGVITFTLFDNTTKTIDTLLEKVAINFDYDDNPSSAHYQNLIIELEDGTYKYIDMSALITEYEFTTSDTIAFTVDQDGAVSASVRDGSITGAKLQPNYLADVTAQANIASAAASSANTDQLKSEGFANGTQGGVPVSSGSPYYENNAKYWKEQAQAIAGGSFAGLSDVDINNPQDGDLPTYNSNTSKWKNSSELKNSINYLYNNTGGKNLLVYPYVHTTKTTYGVTFTDNHNGSVTVQWSGTTSESASFYMSHLSANGPTFLEPGTYIFSGRPGASGTDPSYGLYLYWVDNQGAHSITIYDESYQFTIDSNAPVLVTANIKIAIGSVSPGSPITFYPMIRNASIADDTWVPYAMTNNELTQTKAARTDLTSIIATGSTNTTGAQIPNGAYFYLNGVFCRAIADIATNASFTQNTNYIETTVGDSLKIKSLLVYVSVSSDSHSIGGYYGAKNISSITELSNHVIISATAANHQGYPIPVLIAERKISVSSNTSSDAHVTVFYI